MQLLDVTGLKATHIILFRDYGPRMLTDVIEHSHCFKAGILLKV